MYNEDSIVLIFINLDISRIVVSANRACDMFKGIELHVEDVQFWVFCTTFWQHEMLRFDSNPIIIRTIYQRWKPYKTKEFELLLRQYLKNNICNIQIIPLDHVTYIAIYWRKHGIDIYKFDISIIVVVSASNRTYCYHLKIASYWYLQILTYLV